MELREQIVCAIVGTVDGGDVTYNQWVEAAEEVLQLIQPIIEERDALRAEIETMKKQKPVMWANSSNINSSRINKERGGRGDQHTCSETQTTYHDTPLYTLPVAKGKEK